MKTKIAIQRVRLVYKIITEIQYLNTFIVLSLRVLM